MDKPYFRQIFKPVLENPILVQGLPGFGNVGKVAAYLLIKFCGAKSFAELYSPSFPDYVSVNSSGICRLPRYEFYVAPMEIHAMRNAGTEDATFFCCICVLTE